MAREGWSIEVLLHTCWWELIWDTGTLTVREPWTATERNAPGVEEGRGSDLAGLRTNDTVEAHHPAFDLIIRAAKEGPMSSYMLTVASVVGNSPVVHVAVSSHHHPMDAQRPVVPTIKQRRLCH